MAQPVNSHLSSGVIDILITGKVTCPRQIYLKLMLTRYFRPGICTVTLGATTQFMGE